MRRSPSIVRRLLPASRVIAPCLFLLVFAAAADAASPVSGARRRQPTGDPHTMTIKKLMCRRHLLGPVARPSARAQAGLTDTAARLRRATRTKLHDDDAAIQNGAPARIELGEGTTPSLQPVGVLGSSFDRLPPTGSFSPRPPRGPPAAV